MNFDKYVNAGFVYWFLLPTIIAMLCLTKSILITLKNKYIANWVTLAFIALTQKIKYDLSDNAPELLAQFRVNSKDREYQIWERNPLSIDIYSQKVFMEKLNYIHRNPVQEKWKLSSMPEDYSYSTAKFYETGKDNWGFLTHIND